MFMPHDQFIYKSKFAGRCILYLLSKLPVAFSNFSIGKYHIASKNQLYAVTGSHDLIKIDFIYNALS
jgi:hypothetical protein